MDEPKSETLAEDGALVLHDVQEREAYECDFCEKHNVRTKPEQLQCERHNICEWCVKKGAIHTSSDCPICSYSDQMESFSCAIVLVMEEWDNVMCTTSTFGRVLASVLGSNSKQRNSQGSQLPHTNVCCLVTRAKPIDFIDARQRGVSLKQYDTADVVIEQLQQQLHINNIDMLVGFGPSTMDHLNRINNSSISIRNDAIILTDSINGPVQSASLWKLGTKVSSPVNTLPTVIVPPISNIEGLNMKLNQLKECLVVFPFILEQTDTKYLKDNGFDIGLSALKMYTDKELTTIRCKFLLSQTIWNNVRIAEIAAFTYKYGITELHLECPDSTEEWKDTIQNANLALCPSPVEPFEHWIYALMELNVPFLVSSASGIGELVKFSHPFAVVETNPYRTVGMSVARDVNNWCAAIKRAFGSDSVDCLKIDHYRGHWQFMKMYLDSMLPLVRYALDSTCIELSFGPVGNPCDPEIAAINIHLKKIYDTLHTASNQLPNVLNTIRTSVKLKIENRTHFSSGDFAIEKDILGLCRALQRQEISIMRVSYKCLQLSLLAHTKNAEGYLEDSLENGSLFRLLAEHCLNGKFSGNMQFEIRQEQKIKTQELDLSRIICHSETTPMSATALQTAQPNTTKPAIVDTVQESKDTLAIAIQAQPNTADSATVDTIQENRDTLAIARQEIIDIFDIQLGLTDEQQKAEIESIDRELRNIIEDLSNSFSGQEWLTTIKKSVKLKCQSPIVLNKDFETEREILKRYRELQRRQVEAQRKEPTTHMPREYCGCHSTILLKGSNFSMCEQCGLLRISQNETPLHKRSIVLTIDSWNEIMNSASTVGQDLATFLAKISSQMLDIYCIVKGADPSDKHDAQKGGVILLECDNSDTALQNIYDTIGEIDTLIGFVPKTLETMNRLREAIQINQTMVIQTEDEGLQVQEYQDFVLRSLGPKVFDYVDQYCHYEHKILIPPLQDILSLTKEAIEEYATEPTIATTRISFDTTENEYDAELPYRGQKEDEQTGVINFIFPLILDMVDWEYLVKHGFDIGLQAVSRFAESVNGDIAVTVLSRTTLTKENIERTVRRYYGGQLSIVYPESTEQWLNEILKHKVALCTSMDAPFQHWVYRLMKLNVPFLVAPESGVGMALKPTNPLAVVEPKTDDDIDNWNYAIRQVVETRDQTGDEHIFLSFQTKYEDEFRTLVSDIGLDASFSMTHPTEAF